MIIAALTVHLPNGWLAVSEGTGLFATTYAIMLLALIFLGGGRYISVDYWIKQTFKNKL